MEERRRHQRYAVAWPVRLWVSENTFIAGRTVDASIHGAQVELDRLPTGILELGDVCALTICPGTPEEFHCIAVVRHLGNCYGVGLQVKDELPIPLGASPASGRAGNDSLHPPGGLSHDPDRQKLPTLLVVDGEPTRRDVLTDYLRHEGYEVASARTVEEMFQAIHHGDAHLILLDMGLPDVDTLEVLRRLRRDEPGIGVVIIVGNRELALARIGFDLGAVDCLFKPFDLDRLSSAVESGVQLVADSAAT